MMNQQKIRVQDNAYSEGASGKTLRKCLVEGDLDKARTDILPINGLSVQSLIEDNPGLLLFPENLGEHGDDLGQSPICWLDGADRLHTGNLMGFVSIGNTQLNICSRFSLGDKEDFFLHYMLQKVFCPNLFDMQYSQSDDPVFDFLLYLFPYYFNQAVAQGLFKEYRLFRYNDSNVRGTIDINRHIAHNMPFNGKIAYNTREYSHDNRITELVRHTYEYIKTVHGGPSFLNDSETKDNIRILLEHTPSYSKQDRRKVLLDNTRPVHHPFLTKYTALQRLCVRILHHEEIKFGNNDEKINGILFDGAWLWEEYLNKILSECGFKHPRNKTGEDPIFLFSDNRSYPRYPDFYKKGFILDAKYKRLENGSIDRDDIHQIISYMHVENAEVGAVVYPSETRTTFTKIGLLRGLAGEIYKLSLAIPQTVSDYSGFVSVIQDEENILKSLLQ